MVTILNITVHMKEDDPFCVPSFYLHLLLVTVTINSLTHSRIMIPHTNVTCNNLLPKLT
jgi:hypothetical protein